MRDWPPLSADLSACSFVLAELARPALYGLTIAPRNFAVDALSFRAPALTAGLCSVARLGAVHFRFLARLGSELADRVRPEALAIGFAAARGATAFGLAIGFGFATGFCGFGGLPCTRMMSPWSSVSEPRYFVVN